MVMDYWFSRRAPALAVLLDLLTWLRSLRRGTTNPPPPLIGEGPTPTINLAPPRSPPRLLIGEEGTLLDLLRVSFSLPRLQ